MYTPGEANFERTHFSDSVRASTNLFAVSRNLSLLDCGFSLSFCSSRRGVFSLTESPESPVVVGSSSASSTATLSFSAPPRIFSFCKLLSEALLRPEFARSKPFVASLCENERDIDVVGVELWPMTRAERIFKEFIFFSKSGRLSNVL